MSFTFDANVLLYASDASSAHHARARSFLDDVAAGDELVYLFWPTAMAYLRIATHPAIFKAPLRPSEATANIEGLLDLPQVQTVGEQDRSGRATGALRWRRTRAAISSPMLISLP